MSLSARAIAVEGVGYAVAVFARAGLWDIPLVPAGNTGPVVPGAFRAPDPRIGRYAGNGDIRRGREEEWVRREIAQEDFEFEEMVLMFMAWRNR